MNNKWQQSKYKAKALFVYITLATAILLTFGFCLAPFLWQILTSFKSSQEVFTIPPTYLPQKISLESYFNVFYQRPFGLYIINSILIAGVTAILCVLVGSLAAYGLARFSLSKERSIMGMILIISFFPPIIFLLPLYEIVRGLGWMNNPIALILPYTTLNLPFTIWVLTNFFREIPHDIEDAAQIDGFSPLGILFRIIFPLALPAITTVSILVFIFAWNEFLLALTFMLQDQSRTVPVGIALLSGASVYEIPWDQISAATVVTTLPVIILVLFLQRQILRGLTAGAVKG
jgi:multiple sugar transport system permease protein